MINTVLIIRVMTKCKQCMEHKINSQCIHTTSDAFNAIDWHNIWYNVCQNSCKYSDSQRHRQRHRQSQHNIKLTHFIKSIVQTVILMVIISFINCKPLSDAPISQLSMQLMDNTSHAMDFLVKFGYLPKSTKNSANLISDEQLKDAIRAMQSFANLRPTGLLDNKTIELMKRKRCGVPDVFISNGRRVRRYSLQGSKWDKTNLSWSVRDWSPGLDPQFVMEQFRKAFKVWSDASRLTFTETRRADADIVISFYKGSHGDVYPFDGPGFVLGHAFFPGDDIGGDAHFDADEQWDQRQFNPNDNPNNRDGVSLFSVAAHEFGHSLGLAHSSVSGSLMFPYYQTLDNNFHLPHDDTSAIQELYGPPTDQNWSPHSSLPTPKYTSTDRPNTPTIPKFSTEYPNACDMSIDAIATIRSDIFVFKDKFFWWLKPNRSMTSAKPIEIYRYWTDLPKDLKRVDAVYERLTDSKIVFFIGKQIWVFSQTRVDHGYPQPLTSIGLPSDLERVDVAMIWGHNGKTYLFSGSKYWRFDEQENRVELDYPRLISTAWKGIPGNIDSAFQWSKDSQTYFFKGHQFWKFDNRKMHTSDSYPQNIGPFWFQSLLCRNMKTTSPQVIGNLSSHLSANLNITLFLLNCILFYNFYIFYYSINIFSK
ncbi:collagenase 3-like [Oppia nitens]|uniref:collagenase 3-like n=1 Tax=Oppia nitens TaxID=1686743 RepID=UPI0023D9AC03|nr:collagenase 3-like [Oppia nitens]